KSYSHGPVNTNTITKLATCPRPSLTLTYLFLSLPNSLSHLLAQMIDSKQETHRSSNESRAIHPSFTAFLSTINKAPPCTSLSHHNYLTEPNLTQSPIISKSSNFPSLVNELTALFLAISLSRIQCTKMDFVPISDVFTCTVFRLSSVSVASRGRQ